MPVAMVVAVLVQRYLKHYTTGTASTEERWVANLAYKMSAAPQRSSIAGQVRLAASVSRNAHRREHRGSSSEQSILRLPARPQMRGLCVQI